MESLPTIVLVGLMGAGKTRVGIELARLLDMPFVDADREIEASAGMSIPEIFEVLGEPEFRKGERKVMARLLRNGAKVIASGGGAFIQDDIRRLVKEKAVSVWLKADLATLVERTALSDRRPLLHNVDPAEKLGVLMKLRYPVYAEADITITSDNKTPRIMAQRIRRDVQKYIERKTA